MARARRKTLVEMDRIGIARNGGEQLDVVHGQLARCRLADWPDLDFVERNVGEIVRRCPVVVAGVPASAGAAAVVMAGWEASTAVEANSANTLFSWYL